MTNTVDRQWAPVIDANGVVQGPPRTFGERSIGRSLVKDFYNLEVYRAATIEFITSGTYVFLSYGAVLTSLQSNFESNLAALAFLHVLLIAFFISSALPASGGHFNPILTFTTMLTGHCSVPRAILYITGQSVGAILGALAIKAIVEPATARKYALGGCILRQTITVDGVSRVSGVDNQQGFISEFVFSFAYLHINYAMGLDPKQQPVYGPVLGPIFCGVLVGMTIFISGGLTPGYVGAGFNPARCLGAPVAIGHQVPALWTDYWVYCVAPFCACFLTAAIYHLIPFDHSLLYKEHHASLQAALRKINSSISLRKENSVKRSASDMTHHI